MPSVSILKLSLSVSLSQSLSVYLSHPVCPRPYVSMSVSVCNGVAIGFVGPLCRNSVVEHFLHFGDLLCPFFACSSLSVAFRHSLTAVCDLLKVLNCTISK